jgi:hypothetical protein
MRKKIIGMSVAIALLAILCAQSVTAQNLIVHTWTDKTQYQPGEKGKLKISILNELDEPVEVYNITIEFPWFRYDAEKGEWIGNETVTEESGEPLALITSDGGDHYTEVDFTVPADGRAVMGSTIDIVIATSKGMRSGDTNLYISAPNWPVSLVAFDTWMTSLLVAVVVCTIILAIVVLFATRRTQTPRPLIPRATAPPPPKAKA